MTIKASALLSIVAIWATMIPAVIAEPGEWWSLIFAGLATMAIGISSWRRLGLSRVIAIAGIWAGTALATVESDGWIAIFAFLATATAVNSIMQRTAILNGVAIATAWLVVGIVVNGADGDGSWISVFAFLTGASVANHRSESRGAAAIGWWILAGAIMIATEGSHWLAVIAWFLSTMALGFHGFSLPRRIEWDLLDRD